MSDQDADRHPSGDMSSGRSGRTRGPEEPSAEASEPDRSEERHPDLQADLHERADGAHSEQISAETNLRADPDPPD